MVGETRLIILFMESSEIDRVGVLTNKTHSNSNDFDLCKWQFIFHLYLVKKIK